MKSKLLLWSVLSLLGIGISISAADQVMCTMQYDPVCAEKQVVCIKAPCYPIQQTYGNACTAWADGAKVLYKGECKSDVLSTEQELVNRAYDQGITSISSLDQFDRNGIISRQQASKMIVAGLQSLGVPIWTIKLPAWSCERKDRDAIHHTLLDKVNESCTMGLFKWDNGYFMPYIPLANIHLEIVLSRAGQYSKQIKSYLDSDQNILPNITTSRWDLVRLFQSMYNYINNNIENNKYSELQKQLDDAKSKWASAKLSKYDLIQQKSCFCIEDAIRPMLFTVLSWSVIGTSAVYYDSNSEIDPWYWDSLMSIDKAFALIQEAIDKNAASLNVEYDMTLWYPKVINIDRDSMMADEEAYYKFSIIDRNNKNPIMQNWKLLRFNNKDVSQSGITMNIDATNQMWARICNSMWSDYILSGNQIIFGDMISTLMYCMDEELMAIETAFGNIKSATYTVNIDGLTLFDWTNTWKWIK